MQLLAPHSCCVCGQSIGKTDGDLCQACRFSLIYLDHHNRDTRDLFSALLPIDRARALIRYRHDDMSHEMLVSLKYRHRPSIGRSMGRVMAENWTDDGFLDGIDCIVPVPLHWRRWVQRCYNQSTQLALGISDRTGIPVVNNALKRVRYNRTQTHLGHDERQNNVSNLFRVKRPELLRGKHVLLIDDVLTTGATLTACIEAILEQLPDAHISIATLAKA